MEINTLLQIFEQVGLTVCIIGGFAWYILKKDKDKAAVDKEIRERQLAERDMLIQTIEKYRITNEALLQTNKELAEANRVMLNEFGSKIINIVNTPPHDFVVQVVSLNPLPYLQDNLKITHFYFVVVALHVILHYL